MKTGNRISFEVALIAIFCLSLVPMASGATKEQVVRLEAAENLKYVSQQITKAYFYKEMEIRIVQAKRDLQEGMTALDSDIKTLSDGVTDEEAMGVLTFISFSRDEMEGTLKQPYSEENGALMLDFSESLLEGASLIAGKQGSEADAAAAELVIVKQMGFLLERMNKYYIAHKAGFKDYNNVVQLEKAVDEFEANLTKVNAYSYPASLRPSTEKINKFWPIAKRFYLGIEKGALPIIVMSSTDNLGRALDNLLDYHLGQITTKS
ncbi:MAG: hypothetical protein ABFR63_05270 [Thermodesulfobacteriota bacterium]